MPHQTLKIHPGVNTYETPVLNEASVNICNLIRYAPDPSGLGLVQKLGGWMRYYPNAMPSIPRALWAWEHIDNHGLLAIGCETSATGGVGAPLLIEHVEGTAKSLTDITPRVRQDNVAVDATTVLGSNIVLLGDVGSNASSYDAVYIPAHISVGGVILFGFYQVIFVSANTFDIALYSSQGNPIFPTAAVANGGAVAVFDSTINLSVITVTLANHGYSVGSTYPVLISTTVGGVVLEGDYTVQTVPTANTFTIIAQNAAAATATVSINSGNARYNFYLGSGPLPLGSGYGVGGYGVGGYGTGIAPTVATGANIATGDWTLDNWGSILIAVPTSTTFGAGYGTSPVGGPIYYWSHATNNPTALAIAQGPVANAGAFIAMPQRQIIAYGSEETGVQDPLLVRWCDSNNFFVWNATPVNFAGKFRLTRGSRIVGGMQAGHQGLLWTDVGLWTMTFIGTSGGPAANVYGFEEIARGCGLISKKAGGLLGSAVWWMGQSQFFTLSGNGVQPIECPVWDQIFQNLDTNNLHKIRCAPNSNFGEIAWYYPSLSGGTGEVDSYVKLNTLIGAPNGWDYGTLTRTAWIDQSVLGPPIGAGGNTNNAKFVYQHEVSNDGDGRIIHAIFQTGYFTLNEADVLTFIDQFIPDMKWGKRDGTSSNAELRVTFFVKANFANDDVKTYGPFSITQAVKYATPRFRGALVALQFESVDIGSFWRLGGNRYRYQPDGKFY